MADDAEPSPPEAPAAPRASKVSSSSRGRARSGASEGNPGDVAEPGDALRKKSSGRSKKAPSSSAGGEGGDKEEGKKSVKRRPAAGNGRRTQKWAGAAAPEPAANDADAAAAVPAEGEEAARASGQGAVSSSAPADTRPCMAFAIGEEVVIRIATVARKEESTESAEVKQLQKGSSCQILEYGKEATGRRLKIVDLESGQVGWISCVGRGSGNPIIKSSGKPIQPLPASLEANATDAQKIGAAIADAAAEAPAAGSPTQSPEAFFDPSTVARNKAVSAGDETPAQPELELDPAVNRAELIQKLFDLLDLESKKRLDFKGLRAYAALCGFNDSEDQWAREYDALCTLYGWDAARGADVRDFAQLIDDEEGAAFCTDDELLSVLDEIDQFGVPSLTSADETVSQAPNSPLGSEMGPTWAARVPDDLEISSNFSNPLRTRDSIRNNDRDETASLTSATTNKSRFSLSGVLSSASSKFKPSVRSSAVKKPMDTE